MKFRTTLFLAGKTATGIVIPPEVIEGLGAGKRPPVTVTINGVTHRNTVAVMGGDYMVGVSAERRELHGIKAGDEIEVELLLDTEPRVVEVPEALAKALDAEPRAKAVFESLSKSRKQDYTLPVETAKTGETRQRRVDKAISDLSAKAGST